MSHIFRCRSDNLHVRQLQRERDRVGLLRRHHVCRRGRPLVQERQLAKIGARWLGRHALEHGRVVGVGDEAVALARVHKEEAGGAGAALDQLLLGCAVDDADLARDGLDESQMRWLHVLVPDEMDSGVETVKQRRATRGVRGGPFMNG